MAFEFDTEAGVVTRVEIREGFAYFDPLAKPIFVSDQAVPRKVLFHSGGGELPWFTMGIEVIDGVPECTYLEMSRLAHDGKKCGKCEHTIQSHSESGSCRESVQSTDKCGCKHFEPSIAVAVRDKHVKTLRIETLVNTIMSACAQPIEMTGEGGLRLTSGPATPRQRKVVGRMQRRRTDPNDRETLELVAAVYKANPAAPIKAIMAEIGKSRSTASRLVSTCSEVGLLPPAEKKGKMRK